MKDFLFALRHPWRWWSCHRHGFCPYCNSSEPLIHHCPVCFSDKDGHLDDPADRILRSVWWEFYREYMRTRIPCPECRGSGWAMWGSADACSFCRGRGKVMPIPFKVGDIVRPDRKVERSKYSRLNRKTGGIEDPK